LTPLPALRPYWPEMTWLSWHFGATTIASPCFVCHW